MVILDTDILTLMEWQEHPTARQIWQRLRGLPPGEVATTVITFEEQMRGWLAAIAQAKTVVEQVEKNRRLRRMLALFCSITILDSDERAAIAFQQIKKSKLRVGTMDLKVASIVLGHDATLLTRNLRHFEHIPGLKAEDWSKPPKGPRS